jgi:hypothetical protein
MEMERTQFVGGCLQAIQRLIRQPAFAIACKQAPATNETEVIRAA